MVYMVGYGVMNSNKYNKIEDYGGWYGVSRRDIKKDSLSAIFRAVSNETAF